jgi:hypothetical protein
VESDASVFLQLLPDLVADGHGRGLRVWEIKIADESNSKFFGRGE